MRTALWTVMIMLAALSPAAYADPIESFVISGTFTNGYTLGGSIDIDTATLFITGEDFTVTSGKTLVDTFKGPAVQKHTFAFIAAQSADPYFVYTLFFPAPSASPYAGGTLCSLMEPCGGMITVIASVATGTQFELVSGSVTPNASPVPEPSTSLLVSTGALLAIAISWWRSRRRFWAPLRGRTLRARA